MPVIRLGENADVAEIAAIQAASPEAARWDVAAYLNYDLRVAVCQNRVAGFLASRSLSPDESEILNLAVSPEFRRRGIARALLNALLEGFHGAVFLEVRESNRAALELYKSLHFQEISRRPGYYEDPPETAIVLKFHSC